MKRRLPFIVGLLTGILLIVVWLYFVDLHAMANMFQNINWVLLLPLVVFFILTYFMRSLRWKIILSPIENITVFESFNLCMTNYFINFLIPMHTGELVKSMLLKKMKGTPVSKSLPSVYVDKVADLLPIFLLLIAAPFLEVNLISKSLIVSTSAILLVSALCCFVAFIVFFRRDITLKLFERVSPILPDKFSNKLVEFYELFFDGISSISQVSNKLLEIIGLTVGALILHCMLMWLLFYSFGISLPFVTVFIGYLLLNTSFILPAPPGYSGSLELTYVFIFTYLFGYDKNLISIIAATSHVFVAVLFLFFGLVAMAIIGTKLSTILKTDFEKDLKRDYKRTIKSS